WVPDLKFRRPIYFTSNLFQYPQTPIRAFNTAKLQSKTVSRIPEVVNDFPPSFLINCFQTEWNEMAHKCLFNAEDVGLIPDVYTQNHFLASELKNTQRERGEYRQTTSAAGQTGQAPKSQRFQPSPVQAIGPQLKLQKMVYVIKAHTLLVSYKALHPSKLVVASAGDDQLWRLPEGELIATGQGHSDGSLGLTFTLTVFQIWDLSEGHTGATWGCSSHSGGDFVASCSLEDTVKVMVPLHGHTGSINSVEFLPSSTGLLTSSAEKTILVGHLDRHVPRQSTATATPSTMPHSAPLVTSSRTAIPVALSCCGMSGGRQTCSLWRRGRSLATGWLSAPSGQILAVIGDEVRVVDWAYLQVAYVLKHEDLVQYFSFTTRGEYLLSGASDRRVVTMDKIHKSKNLHKSYLC
uniref:Uncharacterized protein n=1 Tax=Hucho hucho TaxID=62062 RepID=A0A4W5JUY3_9TELE